MNKIRSLAGEVGMNEMKRKLQDRYGFSLIEIVMALGILAFSIMSIMGLIPLALGAAHTAIDTGVRTRILQATRTELLNEPFSTLLALSGTSFKYDADGFSIADSKQATCYQVTVSISGSVALPGGDLRNVYTVQLTGSNVITGQTYTNQLHLPNNGF